MNWTTASSLAHSIFVTHISSSNTMSLKFGSENVISIHFLCWVYDGFVISFVYKKKIESKNKKNNIIKCMFDLLKK
jgi:hypothetical protein